MKRILLALAAGCGGADPVVCDCSPAADCVAGACECPASFMPASPAFLQAVMREDLAQLPGLTTGVGVIQDGDRLHGLLVAFDPATVSIDTELDLAAQAVRVGFGYEVDPLMNIRGAYLATSGTLKLSRACAAGVAGELAAVGAIEIDLFADLAPVENGCAIEVPAVTFAIGEACDE
jgi:hypothetical protein